MEHLLTPMDQSAATTTGEATDSCTGKRGAEESEQTEPKRMALHQHALVPNSGSGTAGAVLQLMA
jgi:hypothetical protein